ncbi:MAG: prephenate dehydrogenase/arogenate dehydrogenase family protein [Candidatus Omnitrophota bacterium]
MKMFNKVAIVGVGVLGGSLGKDLRAKRMAGEVIGIGRRESSLKKARKVGAVDTTFLVSRIKDGVKDADLIILATPVGNIVKLGNVAASYAKDGAIITDVGSTKRDIVEKLEKSMPGRVYFVGSHPMAGSEKGGPLNAERDLFKGRDCFITKTENTNNYALNKIRRFWMMMGSKTITLSPKEHDRIVSKISHMVHIVASALVIANRDVLLHAASGFKDTTRIALADPVLWRDICATNNTNIARSLDKVIKVLTKFRDDAASNNIKRMASMLEDAKDLRGSLK